MIEDEYALRWYRVSCPGPPGHTYTVKCEGRDEPDAVATARAMLSDLERIGHAPLADFDGVSIELSALLVAVEIDASLGFDGSDVPMPTIEVAQVGPPLERQDSPASSWHDQDEAARWQRAIGAIAAREKADRGLDKASSVSCAHGQLWVQYGRLRVPVAGSATDLCDESTLFEYVDRWVAFELLDDADALLERDREYIARWRARLPAEQEIWEQAAALVFADVEPTLPGYQTWRIVVDEDELEMQSRRPDDDGIEYSSRSSMTIVRTPPGWQRPEPRRRALLLPRLSLHTESASTSLFTGHARSIGSVDSAVEHLVNWLQDEIIDDIQRAWPRCPHHEHPLELEGGMWTCPTDGEAVAAVGHLQQPR